MAIAQDAREKFLKDIKDPEKIGALVVQDLFYPATLGALLYNFSSVLASTETIRSKPLATISVIMILVYFTIDYVWTKSWAKIEPYTVAAAVCDAIALVFILLAERAVNPISEPGNFSIAHAAAYFAIIHLLYTIWCAVEKMYLHLRFKAAFTVLFGVNALWCPHLELFVALQILLCIFYVYGVVREVKKKDYQIVD